MEKRFKKYLDKYFLIYKFSQETADYREEVLATLNARAAECRARGMTDEGEIYAYCIDSLGDFPSTLREFGFKARFFPDRPQFYLALAAFILLAVTAFLIAGFATHAWSKVWVIAVCGPLLAAGTAVCYEAKRLQGGKGGIIAARLAGYATSFLTAAIVFLIMLVSVPGSAGKAWAAFPLAIIPALGADVLITLLNKRKGLLLRIIAFVLALFTMLYVGLAGAGAIPWHPYWILPILGAAAALGVLIAWFSLKSRRGSDN